MPINKNGNNHGKTAENEASGLNEEGKVLYEAYRAFAGNGVTVDESIKLEKIDDVLKDADIQLTYSQTKNGKVVSGAVIVDNTGKSVPVR